ncbi:YtcA family lipoprotein [Acetobacter senegalensis]|nr:YtcA family lipoprotein [Acetobacter senegalensis]
MLTGQTHSDQFGRMLRPSARHIGFCATPLLSGCTAQSAPTFSIFGAYFPDWMLCGMIGVAVAVGLRVLFLISGIDSVLSLRLFTYVSLGIIAALLVWLIAFGP